jgi:16S rRNA (cytidine1402-2'-O)-methyltransferase
MNTMQESKPLEGKLYLVGTPIGNLGDMTYRAVETLKAVDVIACEDTRESRKLLTHFEIDKPLTSYHEHNRREQGPRLITRIVAGESIALITDAGMPGISDPGEDLARLAIEAGITVVPIPGPTALATALVASGLPTGRFVFEGFLAREPKLRRRRLRELVAEPRTMIFYEAPHRLIETLGDMADIWGPAREAAVGRELTKHFEEMRRGPLPLLSAHYEATPPRGEIVIVVAGGPPIEDKPTGDWREELATALAAGQKATEAARAIARTHGLARQEVYDAALALKAAPPPAP